MRAAILVLSLTVAFLIGCLVRPLIVPPVRAGTQPATFEYTCWSMGAFDGADGVKTALNKHGKAGWELAGTGGGRNYIWCFKRRLPAAAPPPRK